MQPSSKKHVLFIVYDSITSSYFMPEVLIPLLSLIKKSSNLEVTLLTFEQSIPSVKRIQQLIPAHEKLHLITAHRLPFFGTMSLKLCSWQLRRILKMISFNQLVTRGTFAGWIATHALEKIGTKHPERLRREYPNPLPLLTIQARKPEALWYKNKCEAHPRWFVRRLLQNRLCKKINQIEYEAYRNKRKTDIPKVVKIEAVSPALKDYLITNHRADSAKITIAINDLPESMDKHERTAANTRLREERGIADGTYVYGYYGSADAYNCIPEMLFYFLRKMNKNKNAFLLIITEQKKTFQRLLHEFNIPKDSYQIVSVTPRDNIRHYLAACDAGLLFRHNNEINWVSRPFEMLEYQAVGLKIKHNNTIAWLTKPMLEP